MSPQLYADNLECNSYDVDTLLAAAQYTVSHVKVVGQEASPSKCVLLCTYKTARKGMTPWRNENAGCPGLLDVRDLGGHLDVTQRALAGTLSSRVKEATSHVIAVGALSMGFQRMLGMVGSKYLGSMDVKVLLSLSVHSALSDLWWHVQSCPKNYPGPILLLC